MHKITLQQNLSIIIAVHDLNLVYRYADIVLLLNRDYLAGYGTPDEILLSGCIRGVYRVDSFIVENKAGKFILPFQAQPSV